MQKHGKTPRRATQVAGTAAGKGGDTAPSGTPPGMRIILEPRLSVFHASCKMLRHCFAVMEYHVPGILRDDDPEHLHDFRVASRRARSLLAEAASAFPERITRSLGIVLTDLGQRTNELRDLDVYLQKRREYSEMLPPRLQGGLDGYFLRLEQHRGRVLARIRRWLVSKAFENLMLRWCVYLDRAQEPGPLDDDLLSFASTVAYSRYRKVMKAGRKLSRESPDDDVHRLRIRCKKLRYVIETFYSLYPEKTMEQLVEHLKGMQDLLGLYNDLAVQQQALLASIDEIAASDGSVETAASLGGLVAALDERRRQTRKRFDHVFRHFSGGSVDKLVEGLFANRDGTQAW